MRVPRQLRALRGALVISSLVAVAGLSAAPALAVQSSNPVIQDCLSHPGGLSGHYSVAQLGHALQVMPAETKEYTNCPDVINRARLDALHGISTGSSGGSGSFLPTPVLIILIVLILAAITATAIAVRRQRGGPGAGSGPRGGSGPP
jgi:hypothetical protein